MASAPKPPRTYEHLRPYQFRPGQSGNPKGPPKRIPQRSLRAHLIELLDREHAIDEKTG